MSFVHEDTSVPSSLPLFHVDHDTVCLFDVDVHCISMAQAIDNISQCIQQRSSLHIGMLNAAKIINMRRCSELSADVKQSNLILADGSSIVLASKLLGKTLPERVTGIDLMHAMLRRGNTEGYRVYCLGADEAVSQQVACEIAAHYPDIHIVGRQHGYFNKEEEPSVAQKIADSGADILFVAMTSPKKERFMARWNSTMNIPIVHGVGGSFDVLAGKVQRAPLMWQKYGLEWLYRVKQEPRRLWKRYLVTNTLFLCLLLKEMLSFKR